MSTAQQLPNISSDLIWEIVRDNNSFSAKSKKNGGVQFSRDPLNLTNTTSRKHAGFVNDKAVGISAGEKGAVVVTSKKAQPNKPAENLTKTSYSGAKANRKWCLERTPLNSDLFLANRTYQAVANQTAKNGYRPDLRSAAVERASAVKRSHKPVKPEPEQKLRGNKAKKAAAAAEEN
ncbi:ribosomal l28e [Fusarium albosuccineum]|uniref:Ribosomal l28e n=2 Tax=Fusarium decemcellulare species complex TaxID=1329916 RepID=A0A8H4LJ80_9HYPO|nr:ribosomal l28e [Fusarium albosuccineum]